MPSPLRQMLVRQVRAIFNDTARGERPVMRSDDALFAKDSPIWRVHGDVTSMMAGGVAALLMQMLHPSALSGIWEHSRFRNDMLGRLRRTARFIAVTTYASRSDAKAAIDQVNAIHDRVMGVRPDGAPYSARDPRLLGWVHVTEATCFLAAWQRYGSAPLDARDQDAYFAEFATIANAMGADPIPRSRAEAEHLITTYRPELAADARSRSVARLILDPPQSPLHLLPAQKMIGAAAIDLLPDWATRMHGLSVPLLARPAIRGSARGLAQTMRWAFR
ncbi:oxygenase MpaB family protein [Sphingomonas aestuarii]